MSPNDEVSAMKARYKEILALSDQHIENGEKAEALRCLVEAGKLVEKICDLSCQNSDD